MNRKRSTLFSFTQDIGLGNAIFFIVAVISYLFTTPAVEVGSFSEHARLIVADIRDAIPAAFFLTFSIDVGGSLLMLFWNLMKRQIEKYDAVIAAEAKAEGKAEGKTEGKAEGLAEGKAEAYQEIAAWNTRRLEAEAKGIPFDEAPPSQNGTPETS